MLDMDTIDNSEATAQLRNLPFVTAVKFIPTSGAKDLGLDGKIEIQTPKGRFTLWLEVKRSFLTRSALKQLITYIRHMPEQKTERVLIVARHFSKPISQELIRSNVNFADDAGNIHLQLGNAYNWTVIGQPAPKPISERRPISPALLQLLFQFATNPDSVKWPVRQLEAAAGISKSKAAIARNQMIMEGLLVRTGKSYQLGPSTLISERLVSGYTQVLRPKLVLGQFRAAEKSIESFFARLGSSEISGIKYSITGAPAADLLQHFYQGPTAALFLQPPTRTSAQHLRLHPDREGPITLLRAFGEVVFWRKQKQHMLAPPWLIYAELMSTNDPRAYEAAQELRREYLR